MPSGTAKADTEKPSLTSFLNAITWSAGCIAMRRILRQRQLPDGGAVGGLWAAPGIVGIEHIVPDQNFLGLGAEAAADHVTVLRPIDGSR